MPAIRPFRAVRYAPGTDLSLVSAPAYDVVGPQERMELAARHPHNIVGVTLGRDDDPPSDKYTRAADRLRAWLRDGVLVEDEAELFHLYRMDHTAHGRPRTTAGVVAAVELSPFGAGVAPHEHTMPGPKADRLALMRTTRANLEPLWFVAARPLGGLGDLAARLERERPSADVTDRDGTRHRTWPVPGDAAGALVAAAAAVPFVIADGHHRYETALAYREERRTADGPGPWDATLGLIVDPVEHPPVLHGIHRLVDPPEAAALLARLQAELPLERHPGPAARLVEELADARPGTVGVATATACWTLASDGQPDTAFLAERVLGPAGTPVRYEHDPALFTEAVAGGSVGFVLAPTPLQLVLDHATAGRRMPPKTTLFWPKPRSGLLLRDLDP